MRTLLIVLLQLKFTIVLSQVDFRKQLSDAAIALTAEYVVYDPQYFSIKYPGGDVPKGKGVCTDVIIRAYRKLGVDLQKEVHEDMKEHFSVYPNIWNMKSPDKNIDHRRVPNLMKYFERHGLQLKVTKNAADYLPGDIVCWNLGANITHIGIVINKKSNDGKRYLVVHNIGSGQVLADFLFNFPIIGHYYYTQ